jgi:hypothetical protein
MNYKNAINRIKKEPVLDETVPTCIDPVIKYGQWESRPGWIKIQLVKEKVPIVRSTATIAAVASDSGSEPISLDNYVKLQEKRMAEYDSTRWEGAFREMYPIYPPYPEEPEYDSEEYSDGQYYSDSEYGYSEPEY